MDLLVDLTLMRLIEKYKESSTFVTELTSTRESSSSHVPLTGLGVPMIGAIESSDTTPSSEGPISSMVIKSSSAVITSSSIIAKGASLPPLGDLEAFKVLADTSAVCLSNRSRIDCFKYFII